MFCSMYARCVYCSLLNYDTNQSCRRTNHSVCRFVVFLFFQLHTTPQRNDCAVHGRNLAIFIYTGINRSLVSVIPLNYFLYTIFSGIVRGERDFGSKLDYDIFVIALAIRMRLCVFYWYMQGRRILPCVFQQFTLEG